LRKENLESFPDNKKPPKKCGEKKSTDRIGKV
jgi:hypothetical protein